MQSPLILTTLLMGLAGGPHCIAMCGAACGGITQKNGRQSLGASFQFQAGRLIAYASLGAAAAASVNLLAWFSAQTSILHPVWTFFHVLVLSWGLVLLVYARQPIWVAKAGGRVWQYLKGVSHARGGVFFTGLLWAFMPCGLLYSAILVASLSGNPVQGAMSMASFALGSSLSLIVGPWCWSRLKKTNQFFTEARGMRVAGLLLVVVAAWAIWMDLMHHTSLYCKIL